MLEQRILVFVAHLQERIQQYWDKCGYDITVMPVPIFEAEINESWCKIWKKESHSRSSVAFIALADKTTRTLGSYKAGDIFKSASWKAPAKNVRGNVFLEDFGNCVSNEAHINYMR